VVEVNGMGNIDDGIEDREGKIEDMVDFLCRAFAKFVAKIDVEVGIEMAKVSKVGFEVGIEIPKVAKARVFSNYLEIFKIISHKIYKLFQIQKERFPGLLISYL
jgi:hypothetical protein